MNNSALRYVTIVARLLLGLPLVLSGLNLFLNFIPPPSTPLPEGAAAFSAALMKTGYMMQLIGLTHLVVGVLLVVNRFVPLALIRWERLREVSSCRRNARVSSSFATTRLR